MSTTNSAGSSIVAEGRIVWVSSDLFKGGKIVDMQTKQVKVDAQNNPLIEWGFGLAVPKASFQPIYTIMQQQAGEIFKQGVPPTFAWKFVDGDGIDTKGAPYSTRAGYKGCVVIACKSRIAPRFFKFEGGTNIQVNEGIKNGDYVQVQLSIKAHGAVGQGKSGLYVNPLAVRLAAVGEAIVNVPAAEDVFGNVAPTTPQNYQAPQMAPFPQQQQTVAPPTPVQPNYNVIPQAPTSPQNPQLFPQPNGFPFQQ